MPDGLIPDEGLPSELLRIAHPAGAAGQTTRLILWVNDIVPDADTVLADLTPAAFGGYFFVTVNESDWQTPDPLAPCAATSLGTAPIEWIVTSTGGETVFGWALLNLTLGVCRFVQRFDSADIVPLEVGMMLRLLPQLTLASHACSLMARFRVPRHVTNKRRK